MDTPTPVNLNVSNGEIPGGTHDVCRVETLYHSPGAFGVHDAKSFFNYSLPRLQLQLAIIFLFTQSLHFLLKRFYLPRLVSEILAGIILGPTFLGNFSLFSKTLFPREGEVYLDILAKIGYIFFIFLSGVKMDPRMVLITGQKAWAIGLLAVLLPVTCGTLVSIVFETILHRYRWPTFKNIVGIQNLFPFPVIAAMLVDLKIMNTELGRLALASTLISDLLSNVISAIVSTLRIGWMGWTNVMIEQSALLTICLISIILLIARPLTKWIIRQTPEGKPVRASHITLISLIVLIVVLLTDNAGHHYQYGPFILGLVVPDGPPLGSTLVERLETLVTGLLAPLLVTFCGMKVNLIELYDLNFIQVVWTIVFICLTMKLVAIFVPAIICKVPLTDAGALAIIMSSQGIVQMSFYYNNIVNQTFDKETFSMLTTSVLVQVVAAHLIVMTLCDNARTYAGYQKRDIQHTPTNSELRVLSCAHRLDDVLAVRKILEASFPTKESPLSIYALHLVELIGRATPLLIDHQLGQKTSGGVRTRKMIEVLHSFEQQYLRLVTVQQFTAMSLPKFMHHDICTLAFNKMASLIILPFHRKWNQQGKMILDSGSLRIINSNVLDMAPCSVGILIDRHKIRRTNHMQSVYTIGVIFIGGNDDREALAYARRMAKSHGVHLTVVRFVPYDMYGAETQWDAVLDAEILKETRMQGAHQDNIVYREERVNDGAETALIIHSMEEAFDLITVGRRHKQDLPQISGLSEWNDLPELGAVGDMLAAAELNKPVSVLVVQQQIIKTK